MTSLWDGAKGPCGLVCSSASAPNAPDIGDLWFDTNTDQWKKWSGTAWIVIGGGAPGPVGLPGATQQGQILVSQVAAGFPWAPENGLIEGTF